MQLWTKILMAIVFSWCLMAGATYLGASIIIGKSYAYLEEQQEKIDLNKTQNALHSLISLTNLSLLGFALWDEMYDYAVEYQDVTKKEKNKQFLQANFQPEIFNAMAPNYLDFIVLFDKSGKINPTYSTQFSPDRTRFMPLSQEWAQLFAPGGPLVKLVAPAGKQGDVMGLMNTSKGPLILASHSIRLYSGEGDPHGTLVFGRYLDKAAWENVKKTTKFDITLYTLNEIKNHPNLNKAYTGLLTKNITSVPTSNQKKFLYILLKDITNKPIGMIQIVQHRELNMLGHDIMNYFNLIFIASGVLLILLLFYLLRILIINRLVKINNVIAMIRHHKDFSLRVPQTSHDEIYLISKQMNRMLTTINDVEALLTDIINSMPSFIILLDKHFNITNLNHLAEDFIQLPAKKAKGKPIFKLLPFLRLYEAKFTAALKEGPIQEIENISSINGHETRYFNAAIYSFHQFNKKILALRMDDVSEQIKFQQRMEISDRLAAIGMLTAGLTYEIDQPVSDIAAHMGALQKNIHALVCQSDQVSTTAPQGPVDVLNPPEITAEENQPSLGDVYTETNGLLDKIKENSIEIVKIVQNLKIFVRLDEDIMKKTNIHQGIDAILALLRHYYKDRIDIVKEYGALDEIDAFPGRINQALISIISYALDRTPDHGKMIIKTEMDERAITVKIIDHGPAINEEELLHIFASFYKAKEMNKGLGHGLAMAYTIINDHGGAITVNSKINESTEFIITLPISQEARTVFASSDHEMG